MFKKATSKFAHNPAVISLRSSNNQDLRLLQNLISAEKSVLLTLQKLSADFAKASEALRAWGQSEGDDLGGILAASRLLLNHFSSALLKYASHCELMRRQLKSIRTRVENLDNLKRQRRTIDRKVEDLEQQLEGMDPEHRHFQSRTEALNSFRVAIREMNLTIRLEEAALGDFKRTSTKIWMGLKFGGLVECCEKGAIAGRFGNLVIAEIPEEMTQPGLPRNVDYRRNEVECYVADAHRGVNEVTLSTVPIVGFRDRGQYIQSSSDAPPSDAPPSDTPPAAFHISTRMGYGEPYNNNEPSRLSGEHQHPPTFPQPRVDYGRGPSSLLGEPQLSNQPQCSCDPSSLAHQPEGSRSSLAYLETAQGNAESSMPRTLPSYQQPEVNESNMDDIGNNFLSPVTDPVARSITARSIAARSITARSIATSSNTVGQNAAPSINAPASVMEPSSETAGGQTFYTRSPGTFGGTTPDPFSIRARYVPPEDVEEEEEEVEAPKQGFWSKFFGIFK